MSIHPSIVKIDSATWDRLTALGGLSEQSPGEFALTLIEEGLRMEAHPGIVFRSGPAGRRPSLACGPDVWEVARILREYLSSDDEAVRQTAELMGIPPSDAVVALRYYLTFRAEVDEWLRRLDEEAERAEAAWRLQQGLPVA